MPGIAGGSPDEFQVKYCYLKCAVHGEMEFHMKNYTIQGHPCGTYEKVYALALQRIELFSYFVTLIQKHHSLSVEVMGRTVPFLARVAH